MAAARLCAMAARRSRESVSRILSRENARRLRNRKWRAIANHALCGLRMRVRRPAVGAFERAMQAAPLTELRTETAEAPLSALQQAHEAAPREPMVIDLASIQRCERIAGALLSNLLVGALGDATLVLALPSGEPLDWLTASGLAFAVANRRGVTNIEGPLADDAQLWRMPWATSAAEYWRQAGEAPMLFAPSELSETTVRPDLLGRSYAAFVDAHLTPVQPGPAHPLTDVVWPWLDRLLPRHRDPSRRRARRGFITDVGRVVAETIANVREHGVGGAMPLHSLVQLAVTRGGRGSTDRLHLIVQDNGPGIAATARQKVHRKTATTLLDHQLIFKLFDGSLPPWGRGRGQGLPTVHETARRLGGTMQVWTGRTRASAGMGATPLVSGESVTRFDGTIIALSLPMPA